MIVRKEEKYLDIPGLEITRANVTTISDFKVYVCLSQVVTELKPLDGYVGFKTCKFQDQTFVIYNKVTNSLYLEGTNERQLIKVELIPVTEFLKIKIADKNLIEKGLKPGAEVKIFVPGADTVDSAKYDEALAKTKELEEQLKKAKEAEKKAKEAEKKAKEAAKKADDANSEGK